MGTHRDILIVEDEAAIADLLRRMLVRADYTVRIAGDGRQALAELARRIPTILLLDIVLPDLSGFSVLEYIQQQHLRLPTIIITGNPLLASRFRMPWVRHVLIKPFRMEELFDCLHTIDEQPSMLSAAS
jgi:DNA-binding response OmpR family regulator